MAENQRQSDRLAEFLKNGDGERAFENMTLLRLQHPQIARDLTEFERLSKRQMELLDAKDEIERELEQLDDRLEGPAKRIREFLYNF